MTIKYFYYLQKKVERTTYMIKVIKGKKYDTHTAESLANYCNEDYGFNFVDETLYRKHNGEYFLYGDGGPATCYGISIGNVCRGSESIIPMNESEAREWVEEHCSGEKYIEVFGDIDE